MKLLAVLAMLVTFSAFAGDSYLICEKDDYQVVNIYIGETRIIEDTEYLIPDHFFSYTFNTENFEMEAELIDVHGAGSLDYKKVTLEYYKEVEFFEGVSCYIAD